ncbi:MAG: AraC family transcriptional regulator [Clostridia bacterium]|nr:AraC family transcriptional regulator [Clostridia bacterium]
MENICKFIPVSSTTDIIQTLNFVHETKRHAAAEEKIAIYRVHYVTAGSGLVQCGGVCKELHPGDVFFAFPAVPFTLSGDNRFSYMYISYIGLRANAVMERLRINSRNFYFPDLGELEQIWRQGISLKSDLLDLMSESVLLHTLARIGERAYVKEDRTGTGGGSETFLTIKKYIDDHFSDSALSLEHISEKFSYNKKYLSTAFKKHFKIGVVEYINTVRINYACELIRRGYTGVTDIAGLCGYRDALYFSKVFKRKTGQSPKSYISEI